MTDRLKGFTVVLVADIREDDSEEVVRAIRMIKGVLDVSPSVVDSDDWMNRRRIRAEVEDRLFRALHEEGGAV